MSLAIHKTVGQLVQLKTQSAPKLKLRRQGLNLELNQNGEWVKVEVRCASPWLAPEQGIALRELKDQKELLFIDDLKQWSHPLDQDLLRSEIERLTFRFAITKVLLVEDKFELRHWSVITQQGKRQFQTRTDDWPMDLPNGERVIKDLYGDLYTLPHPLSLDPISRAKIDFLI